MSEPVSNAAAENVLASIRRLVSEEKRPLRGLASAGETARRGLSDKLVLTPSLRVDAPEAGSGAGNAPEGWTDDDPAPPGVDADATGGPDVQTGKARFMNVEDEDAVDETAPVLRLDESVRLKDKAEPATTDTDVTGMGDETMPAAADSDDAPSAAPLVLEPEDRSDAGTLDDTPAGGAGSAIGRMKGAGNDTLDIDEALLRELVGEVVREELRGALGERITRNVRKLVRREILRALASKELE